jgi:hypothetical protein
MTQSQFVKSGGSFLSENQRAVTFGLGNSKTAERIEILWPSGDRQSAESVAANQVYLAREGAGLIPEVRKN